jgi:alginate O-acetyltransferase complex protein AlgI
MRFNSLDYFLFIAAVIVTLFSITQRYRKPWLIIASLFSYMCWSPLFALLILYSTTVNYFVGRRLEASGTSRVRKRLMLISCVANLGPLLLFKYYNFFVGSWAGVLDALGLPAQPPLLHLLLPIGISFYTLEAIAYTADVYFRKSKAETNYGNLLLFLAFFPTILAGPIVRARHLIPQFDRVATFEYERVREGLLKILWGLFKKIVIADRLGVYVDLIYNSPAHHVGSTLTLATLFYSFQVYCDFSAYSDIAIGTSQIMGFDLLRNFRRPIFANSFRDYWSRWHISLSTWFRDYVYIPLGGNRRGFWIANLNVLIVFLVSGLWHGAKWTFVLWGLYHGVFLLGQNLWRRYVPTVIPPGPVKYALQVVATFTVVGFSRVLFRANSVHDAMYIYREIFTHFDSAHFFAGSLTQIVYGVFGIGVLLAVELFTELGGYPTLFHARFKPVRWLAYAGGAILLLLIGVVDGGQFIYARF